MLDKKSRLSILCKQMMPPRLARHKGYMQARVSSVPKRQKPAHEKFAPSQSQVVDENSAKLPFPYCVSLHEPVLTVFSHSDPGWPRINGLRS